MGSLGQFFIHFLSQWLGSIVHYWLFLREPQYVGTPKEIGSAVTAQDFPFGRNLELSDILPPNLSGIDGSGLSF